MESSCLYYPKKEPLVLIRASQMPLCDGNHCAAALLSYFEYWHNNRLDTVAQWAHENEVAIRHGEGDRHEPSLLQYHTEDAIELGLLDLYGRKAIRKALALLVAKKYVSLHRNPIERYHFDRTHYFLFHPEIVQADINAVPHEAKRPHRKSKKASTRREITIEEAKNKERQSKGPLREKPSAKDIHTPSPWAGYFLPPREGTEEVEALMEQFYTCYATNKGEDHPLLYPSQLRPIYRTLAAALGEVMPVEDLVDHFFARSNGGTDHNLKAFATPGMLRQLAKEWGGIAM